MLREPVDVFEVGQRLYKAKQMVTKQCVDDARSKGLSVVGAQRKAASAFYQLIGNSMGYSQETTAQYVRIYERFVDSKLRSKIEGLFNIGELALLASYADYELEDVVRAKEANPSITRDALVQMLKDKDRPES